jgi:xylitol oxidase
VPGASTATTNWAGNVRFRAAAVRRPATVAQVQQLVTSATRVRVLGTGHSFSPVADTTGLQLSMTGLPPLVQIDTVRRQAKVAAGLRYGDIVRGIDDAGFALPNLASLPHLSVAGAVATGTHGSGVRNQGLAAAVAGLELVTAEGDLVELDRADPRLASAVVSLGCLGAVVSVTLDLVPSFHLRQVVYVGMPLADLMAHLPDVLARAYSVSVFTGWRGDTVDQVWLKAEVGSDIGADEPFEATWLSAGLADRPVHMIPGASAAHCTTQLGVAGPWFERLPHFRLEDTPSSGDELQSEYLLPIEHAVEALEAVARIGPLVSPVLQVSELRTVAADDLWLSPTYRRPTLAIHFTWLRDVERVLPVVRAVEAELMPLGARPHWGKIFEADPAIVAARYDRLDDFVALATSLDPTGRFRNDFTDRYLFDPPPTRADLPPR